MHILIDLHLLRPWWLLALVPLLICCFIFRQKKGSPSAWEAVCDKTLLPYLLAGPNQSTRKGGLFYLLMASLFIIISLTGPTWSRKPLPTLKKVTARVVVLDLSQVMLNKDLPPDRLSRAIYILHDLFNRSDLGQIALVVYSEEPFVVSPLTEDGKTIATLLPMLKPSIMPVEGQNPDAALRFAKALLGQAGFQSGQLLLVTGSAPDAKVTAYARVLSREGVTSSILPMVADTGAMPLFEAFAKAGKGLNLSIEDPSTAINQWLKIREKTEMVLTDNTITLWNDEGGWFILAAMALLLPVFRRNWLLRIYQ